MKDARRLTASFGLQPSYLTDEFDRAGERYQYYVHGFEQSRRFRGLKVWMSFKRYERARLASGSMAMCGRRSIFILWSRKHPESQTASEPPMSAICIRYCGASLDEADSKELHAEVARRVEQSGKFWFSTTELKGKTWFRINPVNFRTRTEHMDQVLAFLEQECRLVLESRQFRERATSEIPRTPKT